MRRTGSRRRIAAIAGVCIVVGVMGAPTGQAADTQITTTLTSTGTRTLGVVAPVVLAADLNLDASKASNVTVVVTEAAAGGTNPWSVTSQLCGAQDGDTGTAGFQPAIDCAKNELTRDDVAASIPGSKVSITDTDSTVVQVAGGGTSTAGGGTLDAVRTLINNTGQVTTSIYTGNYTYLGPLSVDLSTTTATGVFYGFVKLTLVQ